MAKQRRWSVKNPGADFMVACLGALGYERVAAVLAQIHRPRDVMSASSAQILSDRDAAHLYAYLASVAAGKPASEIPIRRSAVGGDQTRGDDPRVNRDQA